MDTKRGHSGTKPVPPHIIRHLTALRQSGKTVAAYCREAGISTWSIYDWKRRYGTAVFAITAQSRTTSPLAAPPVSFTELGTLLPAGHATPRFEIQFPAGARISVYKETTVAELQPIISVLDGRSAVC